MTQRQIRLFYYQLHIGERHWSHMRSINFISGVISMHNVSGPKLTLARFLLIF